MLLAAATTNLFGTALLSTDNYVRYYASTDPRVSYACRNVNGVACNGQTIVPGTAWVLDYSSDTQSAFGILRGRASAYLTGTNNGVTPPTFVSVGGRANYFDTTTITGGVGSGTQTLRFHVTGTSSTSGSPNSARAQLQYIPFDSQGNIGPEQNFAVDSFGNTYIPINFTFGVPFTYEISFYSLAQILQYSDGSFASSDYSHTVVLDQVKVADGKGNLVSNFGIVAESGTSYSANGVVPEPASWLLIAVGGAALAMYRRRPSAA